MTDFILIVMDGHFVPNLSFGPAVVGMARRCTNLHLSVHLMMSRPDLYLDRFIEEGADTLLIHIESKCDARTALEHISSKQVRPGVTLNPETAASSIEHLLPVAKEVLCMTVHPGFGGQAFISTVLPKIASIRNQVPHLDISVDGGISPSTGARASAHGANILLAGSSLFNAKNMADEVARMRTAAASTLYNALEEVG